MTAVGDRVHDVDREAGLVEHVGHPDPVDLEGRGFERSRRDHDVALLGEDAVHPVHDLRRVAGRLDGEGVGVLVLEVPGLVRPQTGERLRDR
jgi:hypothetical protein